MDATDAAWHVAGFFAPAIGLGGIASVLTWLCWRREARAGILRLWLSASLAAAIVSAVGLVAFAHDGRMLTYAAMVVACAAALWWRGFRAARR